MSPTRAAVALSSHDELVRLRTTVALLTDERDAALRDRDSWRAEFVRMNDVAATLCIELEHAMAAARTVSGAEIRERLKLRAPFWTRDLERLDRVIATLAEYGLLPEDDEEARDA